MITQSINLNLIPGAVPPRVNVTQYDEGSRTIVANLYNGTSTFTPSAGTTAKVKGTKPDKHGFEYDATISGSTVEIDLTQQMSCVAGDVPCEVELTLNDEVLGTGTFVLRVKASALADDTDISETEIPAIVDAARSSAASAAASAEQAQEAANSVSVEYTVTGNPISVSAFPTEATTSMTIAPTQNLHGYDKPWAGGAGKNLLNPDIVWWGNNYSSFEGTESDTLDTRARTTPAFAFPYVGTYTMSGFPDGVTGIVQVRCFDSEQNDLGTATLSGNTFTTLENTAYIYILVGGTGLSHDIFDSAEMQIESGSSATAWTPYANVCPITGITTATVQTTDGETTNTASMALGETVYGGSVNFNAGTGSKTKASVTLTAFAGKNGSTVNDMYFFDASALTDPLKPSTNADNVYPMSESFDNAKSYEYLYQNDIAGIAMNASGNLAIGFSKAMGIDTVAKANAWLTSNPLHVVYTLATPTTLSLTPDTLTMLNGEQTVSGNGETVTLTYDGNVKQYIDTKVPDAPTTDGTYTLTCVVSGGVPTYSWT